MYVNEPLPLSSDQINNSNQVQLALALYSRNAAGGDAIIVNLRQQPQADSRSARNAWELVRFFRFLHSSSATPSLRIPDDLAFEVHFVAKPGRGEGRPRIEFASLGELGCFVTGAAASKCKHRLDLSIEIMG